MIKLEQIQGGKEMLEDVKALMELLISPNGAELIGYAEENEEEATK